MNRRAFAVNIAKVAFTLAAAGNFLAIGSCGSVYAAITKYVPVGLNAFSAIVNISAPSLFLPSIPSIQSTGLKSRSVYFCSYFDWIGEVREFALLPILKQLAGIFETKEWGVATNNINLDIQ